MIQADGRKKWPVFLLLGLLAVAAVVTAFRIGLSHYAAHRITSTLENMDRRDAFSHRIHFNALQGFRGIARIDITRNGNPDLNPLLRLENLRVSLEWSAVVRGKLIVDVHIEAAELNLLRRDFQTLQGTLREDDGETILAMLKQAPVNDFAINRAHITFTDAPNDSNVTLAITDISLIARDMVDASSRNDVPASAKVRAKVFGGGDLRAHAQSEMFQERPGLSVEMVVEDIDLADVSEAIRGYTSVDLKSGTLNIASRITIEDSRLQGFARQAITDLHLQPLEKPKELFSRQFAAMIVQNLKDGSRTRFSDSVTIDVDLSAINGGRMSNTARVLKLAAMKLFNFEQNEALTADDLES